MKALVLKAMLVNVPDDAEVVTSGDDHTYVPARAVMRDAERYQDGDLAEHYPGVSTNKGSTVVKVLVIA